MKQNELKKLCESGAIKNARIVHAMLSEKWNLQIEVKKAGGVDETVVLHSKRNQVREFSSIEAVIRTIKDIGLGEARIKIV